MNVRIYVIFKYEVIMKYTETGFRPLYHNFCVFPLNEEIKKVVENFPGFIEADGVLTYGYCDKEAGFTLELLCCVKKTDEGIFFLEPPSDKTRAIVRIGAVFDVEYVFIGYGDDSIKENFLYKIEMISHYNADAEVEISRTIKFLDEFRHKLFPDDVFVITIKNGLNPEGFWARITGLEEDFIIGTLLNEPDQNFGYHAGDAISMFIYEDDEGKNHLISDMNVEK